MDARCDHTTAWGVNVILMVNPSRSEVRACEKQSITPLVFTAHGAQQFLVFCEEISLSPGFGARKITVCNHRHSFREPG